MDAACQRELNKFIMKTLELVEPMNAANLNIFHKNQGRRWANSIYSNDAEVTELKKSNWFSIQSNADWIDLEKLGINQPTNQQYFKEL